MNEVICLKIKTIKKFLDYISALEVGKEAQYFDILHNISFIETYNPLDKNESIYDHLIMH